MQIFEFTQPEDIWGIAKPGISFVDRMGVPLPIPPDLRFERDTSVHLADGSAPPTPPEGEAPSTLVIDDAVQEVWLDNGTLYIHTIDDFTPGGFGQWLAKGGGDKTLAVIKMRLGPEEGLDMVADPAQPVLVLTGDPRVPPVSAEA